jgi:hypothetical protein
MADENPKCLEAEMLMNKRAIDKLYSQLNLKDETMDKLVKLMRKHLELLYKNISKLDAKEQTEYLKKYDEYIRDFHKSELHT